MEPLDIGTACRQGGAGPGEFREGRGGFPVAAPLPEYRVIHLRVGCGLTINRCYIVVDRLTGQAAVVDPAWQLDTVRAALRRAGAELTTILLTHSHHDHVNLVAPLLRHYRARVVMARQEAASCGFRSPGLTLVEHGDRLLLGGTAITCLLTPGHSAGSLCYLLSASLFTGDTVFIEGCGICSTTAAAAQMFRSFQMIKGTVDPRVLVFPGHCYGREPGHDLEFVIKENIYFNLDRQDMFVGFRMRKGQRNLFDFR